jgi:hypothetical protein
MKVRLDLPTHKIAGEPESVAEIVLSPESKTETMLELAANGISLRIDTSSNVFNGAGSQSRDYVTWYCLGFPPAE